MKTTTTSVKKLGLGRDERGAVLSIELVMVATVVLLGSLVGLAAYRDSVVQELGDTAASVGRLQQGYSVNAVVSAGNFVGDFGFITSYEASSDGSSYVDENDLCETPDPDNPGPVCITIDETSMRQESSS